MPFLHYGILAEAINKSALSQIRAKYGFLSHSTTYLKHNDN